MAVRVFLHTPTDAVIRAGIAQLSPRQALRFAMVCTHYVWRHFPDGFADESIHHAHRIAQAYLDGTSSVHLARLASLEVHRYARTQTTTIHQWLYRVVGHMVATIHVKTHAYGPYAYGLSALHAAFPEIPVSTWTTTLVQLLHTIQNEPSF